MFVPSDLLTGICIVKLKTPLEAANLAASKPKLQICSLARLPIYPIRNPLAKGFWGPPNLGLALIGSSFTMLQGRLLRALN